MLFFEKKNQKTFARLSPASPRQKRKSLLLLFFRKEVLAFCLRRRMTLRLSALRLREGS